VRLPSALGGMSGSGSTPPGPDTRRSGFALHNHVKLALITYSSAACTAAQLTTSRARSRSFIERPEAQQCRAQFPTARDDGILGMLRVAKSTAKALAEGFPHAEARRSRWNRSCSATAAPQTYVAADCACARAPTRPHRNPSRIPGPLWARDGGLELGDARDGIGSGVAGRSDRSTGWPRDGNVQGVGVASGTVAGQMRNIRSEGNGVHLWLWRRRGKHYSTVTRCSLRPLVDRARSCVWERAGCRLGMGMRVPAPEQSVQGRAKHSRTQCRVFQRHSRVSRQRRVPSLSRSSRMGPGASPVRK
jgi:hypothetical protein